LKLRNNNENVHKQDDIQNERQELDGVHRQDTTQNERQEFHGQAPRRSTREKRISTFLKDYHHQVNSTNSKQFFSTNYLYHLFYLINPFLRNT